MQALKTIMSIILVGVIFGLGVYCLVSISLPLFKYLLFHLTLWLLFGVGFIIFTTWLNRL